MPISDIISLIMGQSDMGKRMLEARAADAWGRVMGPTVMHLTEGVVVRDGIMKVKVSSSVMRHELLMLKGQILEELARRVGAGVVKDIIFR